MRVSVVCILLSLFVATADAFPVSNANLIRRAAVPATTTTCPPAVRTIIIDVVGSSTRYISTINHPLTTTATTVRF
ncbi:hypothetical protein BJ741DRAFT_637668 [Chytriomyces cf. hyalinus JEL632]|nr:hypothetical protein BJ741DRAFT_637668 [Chytriomyces cf. hyalinus JEL632]